MEAPSNPIFSAVAPFVPPIDPATPVIDFEKSQGARLYDKAVGQHVIDFASHFASLPLGYNHPDFFDSEFEKELLQVSRIKIANLDILSDSYEKFLTTFRRVVGIKGWDKYFFIDGGALGVENALKAAMDWKINRNIRKGKGEKGTDIIHFREAFHGRTGYTLSLTNTQDPNKTRHFAKFPWPRIINPKMRFPMEGRNLEATLEDERAAKAEIDRILAQRADEIAAILIEPIQGEGGDNHFRPEFLKYLRDVADANDVMLIYDEVQSGMCTTGKVWAHEHHGVRPDIVCFAKKAQVGGIICSPRIMEEEKNVFTVPSRISSTWGASLADMVRCRKYLEIIERDNLIENAARRGEEILEKLHGIEQRTEMITNVRGKGCFIAFDLVQPSIRTDVYNKTYDNGLMVLICGDRSIRFRPHLNVTSEVIDEALSILEKTLKEIQAPVLKTS